MNKTHSLAVLAVASGLSGCAHVTTSQSVDVDANTRLVAHLSGAAFQAKTVPLNTGVIHREIVDSEGKVLFAYDFKLTKGTGEEMYSLRLMPSARKPTFSAVREVGIKSRQQAVRVDLMENSATGEKVTDELRLEDPVVAKKELMSPLGHLIKVHNMIFSYFHGR